MKGPQAFLVPQPGLPFILPRERSHLVRLVPQDHTLDAGAALPCRPLGPRPTLTLGGYWKTSWWCSHVCLSATHYGGTTQPNRCGNS